MNQILKDVVYSLGTPEQVSFIATTSGMDNEEKQFFQMLHERKTDQYVMDVMHLNKKSFQRIERSVSSKLKIAVFYCINFTMGKHSV